MLSVFSAAVPPPTPGALPASGAGSGADGESFAALLSAMPPEALPAVVQLAPPAVPAKAPLLSAVADHQASALAGAAADATGGVLLAEIAGDTGQKLAGARQNLAAPAAAAVDLRGVKPAEQATIEAPVLALPPAVLPKPEREAKRDAAVPKKAPATAHGQPQPPRHANRMPAHPTRVTPMVDMPASDQPVVKAEDIPVPLAMQDPVAPPAYIAVEVPGAAAPAPVPAPIQPTPSTPGALPQAAPPRAPTLPRTAAAPALAGQASVVNDRPRREAPAPEPQAEPMPEDVNDGRAAPIIALAAETVVRPAPVQLPITPASSAPVASPRIAPATQRLVTVEATLAPSAVAPPLPPVAPRGGQGLSPARAEFKQAPAGAPDLGSAKGKPIPAAFAAQARAAGLEILAPRMPAINATGAAPMVTQGASPSLAPVPVPSAPTPAAAQTGPVSAAPTVTTQSPLTPIDNPAGNPPAALSAPRIGAETIITPAPGGTAPAGDTRQPVAAPSAIPAPAPRIERLAPSAPLLAPAIGVAQPAARAFAAAIAAAGPRVRRAADEDTPAQMLTPMAPVAESRPAQIVERAPLNLHREDWPHRLIDRIEAVRDAANAQDTRIRLVPEALGKIEVQLRQDGETLHVRLSADQAQTRMMLAEAQPRLADLAAERGLRLGQTSVDGGTSTQPQGQPGGQNQRPLPQPAPPRANHLASAVDVKAEAESDGRIA